MEFVIVPGERFNDVIAHLRKTFFCDEPLNKSVKLCGPNEGHDELERQSLASLRDGLSVFAITEDNQIAGVCINGLSHRGDIEKALDNLENTSDDSYRSIFTFLYEENSKLDLFNKFNVDIIFELRILSVDPTFRGQSVAKRLIEKSLEIGKKTGAKIAKTDATSFYSQNIVKSFGFETEAEIIYENHLNSNGEVIFKVESPHTTLKIMHKMLSEVNSNECL